MFIHSNKISFIFIPAPLEQDHLTLLTHFLLSKLIQSNLLTGQTVNQLVNFEHEVMELFTLLCDSY